MADPLDAAALAAYEALRAAVEALPEPARPDARCVYCHAWVTPSIARRQGQTRPGHTAGCPYARLRALVGA